MRPVCELTPEATVRDRLHWLASREAEIITEGDPRPRMHS
jgi:tRNA isopentenyl-2-thiomethyl-A-37 hydroxylase MiaE